MRQKLPNIRKSSLSNPKALKDSEFTMSYFANMNKTDRMSMLKEMANLKRKV